MKDAGGIRYSAVVAGTSRWVATSFAQVVQRREPFGNQILMGRNVS